MPPEPLYPLKIAAELVPFPTVNALVQYLFQHKDLFPAHYRKYQFTQIRLLSESEIIRLREMLSASRAQLGKRGRPSRSAWTQSLREVI